MQKEKKFSIFRLLVILVPIIVCIFVAFLVLAVLLEREPLKPDISDVQTFSAVDAALQKVTRPRVVEEPVKKDDTLYDATAFLSTNGFNSAMVLSKSGYFTYELLETADFDELNNRVDPTNVSIHTYYDAGYTNPGVMFSGFIYKIDYDYIYIGTAGHCIVDDSKLNYVQLVFFNREEIRISMKEHLMGNKFMSEEGDYAMYRIPVSAVSRELLLQFKTVTYNRAAIDEVLVGDNVYLANIYCRNIEEDYDRLYTVQSMDTEYNQARINSTSAFLRAGNYYLTDLGITGGQSGSALFDEFGNLVGIASGTYSDYPVTGLFTKANRIDELYQRFIEKDLEKCNSDNAE